jgi:hypothetical protein
MELTPLPDINFYKNWLKLNNQKRLYLYPCLKRTVTYDILATTSVHSMEMLMVDFKLRTTCRYREQIFVPRSGLYTGGWFLSNHQYIDLLPTLIKIIKGV